MSRVWELCRAALRARLALAGPGVWVGPVCAASAGYCAHSYRDGNNETVSTWRAFGIALGSLGAVGIGGFATCASEGPREAGDSPAPASSAPPGYWGQESGHAQTGRGSSPVKYYGKVWREPTKMSETPDPVSAHSVRFRLLTDQAAASAAQKQYGDAERALRAALETAREGYGPEDPHTAAAMANLADLCKLMGRFAEARTLLSGAEGLLRDIYGDDHPFVAWVRHSLATVAVREGKYQDAIALYEDALARQSKALGATHPEAAQTLFALASARFSAGQHEEARRDFARSLEIIDDQGMAVWPIGLRAMELMGMMYLAMGDVDAAEGLARRILATAQGKYELHVHAVACSSLSALARALATKGHPAAAAAILEDALRATQAHLGPSDPACRQLAAASVQAYIRHPDPEARAKGVGVAEALLQPLERDCRRAEAEADKWQATGNLRRFTLALAASRACLAAAAGHMTLAQAAAACGDCPRFWRGAAEAEAALSRGLAWASIDAAVREAVGKPAESVRAPAGSEERETQARVAVQMIAWSGETVGSAVAMRARLLAAHERCLQSQLGVGEACARSGPERSALEDRLRDVRARASAERAAREKGAPVPVAGAKGAEGRQGAGDEQQLARDVRGQGGGAGG